MADYARRPRATKPRNVSVDPARRVENEGFGKLQLDILQRRASSSDRVEGLQTLQSVANATDEVQNGSALQRKIIVRKGKQVDHLNVAAAWKAEIGDYAITPSIINGKEIPPSANKEGMLHRPDFFGDPPKMGLKPHDQVVDWRIDAPVKGPWVLKGPYALDELDAFAGLEGYKPPTRTSAQEAVKYAVIVRGDPNDDALRDAIITHEMHHVQEQTEVVDDVLKPWDQKAEQYCKGKEFRDPLTALIDFDKAVGNTQAVADKVVGQLETKGKAFHDTPLGKAPRVVRTSVNPDTKIYTVYLKLH